VIGKLAATYYLKILPAARESNKAKVESVRLAFWLVAGGFATLVVALLLTVVGASV
jgi:hypothetical protein